MTTRKIHIPLIFAMLFTVSFVRAQEKEYTLRDREIFREKIEFAKTHDLLGKPVKKVFFEIAKSFVGTPYGAHTIESSDGEKLKISFDSLDCYTFVETSFTFARIIARGDTSFLKYFEELKKIRYRDGKPNGYASRLHYFTDWIDNLSAREIVKDKTREIGGIPYKKKIDFMSTHAYAYRQLKFHPELIEKIKETEKNLSAVEHFFIPENQIAKAQKFIESGDIIAITTDIKGLDVMHVGIAVKSTDGNVYLLHAPDIGFAVQISDLPLSEYIKNHKHQTGIIVCEPM